MQAENRSVRAVLRQRRWWVRLVIFIVLFLAWSGLGAEEFLFAVVGAAAAATVSLRQGGRRAERFRPAAFLKFIPYFLMISLRGGVDVARRAFSPSMPVHPAFVEYHLRVATKGPAAIFFCLVISLVPGTLCVELQEKSVLVHILDENAQIFSELERLERRVAPVFGETVDGGVERGSP